MNTQIKAESRVTCYKCGSDTLTIHELWKGHSISFNQVNGKIDFNEGIMEPGSPYRVEAECVCGHTWTIRKAIQIGNIIKD